MSVRSQAQWLLVIVHLSGQVDGITRLQKLAFLTNEWVPGIESVGFYDDWRASKYGPFSPSLGDDVSDLIMNSLLKEETIESAAGYSLQRFEATSLGVTRAISLEQGHPKLADMIRKSITGKYAKAPLMSLLHDVYYLFPQYSTESEIAGDIYDVAGRR